MIRVVGARWGAVLVAMGLMLGPVAVSAADGDDDSKVEAEHEVAQIKIEIKLESGRVVKPEDLFTVDFGVENSLEIQAEGSNHQFHLKVDRKADKEAKVVALTVGYDRDGEPIVAPYTFDAKLAKREILRIEGGMALAFTITPKKVTGDAPSDEEEVPEEPDDQPRDKIEDDGCAPDDPLCGV